MNRHRQRQILAPPVAFVRRFAGYARRVERRAGTLVRAQGHARLRQRFGDCGQGVGQLSAVNQQHLGGIAGSRILRLRVHDDARGHLRVAVRIHIHVAHAVAVPQHRNAAVFHDVTHKSVRAARDDEVDILVHFEHDGNILARGQQAAPAVRQARGDARVVHDIKQRFIGMQRLPAALEQHGVAALEAQPADLDQRVGPRFKDHADHADGAADARKHQPVGQFGAQLLLPDGIVHRGQLFQTRADVAELVLVKLEPLERGRGQPFLFGLPHIDIVRFENLSCFRAKGGGNRQQRAVARLARRRGQRKTRLLGGVRHVGGGHFPIIHTAPLSPCSAWPFRRPAAGFRSSPAPPSAAPFRCDRLRP